MCHHQIHLQRHFIPDKQNKTKSLNSSSKKRLIWITTYLGQGKALWQMADEAGKRKFEKTS